ncbi:MFS transporter, partial [Xanthomonas citri pv. citri]|nr:MFS transporter [Xanthomonas citri pv. citri]
MLLLGVGADGMGVLMTLSGLGFLLLGVPIGIVVDRHLSPQLLAATGLAKAAVLGSLVVAWAFDALTFGHLAAVMALLGVLTVLAETTQTALVPRVVPATAVAR